MREKPVFSYTSKCCGVGGTGDYLDKGIETADKILDEARWRVERDIRELRSTACGHLAVDRAGHCENCFEYIVPKPAVRPGRPAAGTEHPPRVMIGFGVLPDEYDRIVATAKECSVGIAAFCRQALDHYLEALEIAEVVVEPSCMVCHGTDKYCGAWQWLGSKKVEWIVCKACQKKLKPGY